MAGIYRKLVNLHITGTNVSEQMAITSEPRAKQLEVKDASEIAEYYNVPKPLMNMMFVVIGETAYPKEPFLLMQGHKRGIQAIEVTKPVLNNGEWSCEARIYPKVEPRVFEALMQMPEKERREYWDYFTKPTVEWGRASAKNVRMSTMQEWLDAIAIKRAVCRALRLFTGIGQTSFEEMPEVEVSKDEAESARSKAANAKPAQVVDTTLDQHSTVRPS